MISMSTSPWRRQFAGRPGLFEGVRRRDPESRKLKWKEQRDHHALCVVAENRMIAGGGGPRSAITEIRPADPDDAGVGEFMCRHKGLRANTVTHLCKRIAKSQALISENALGLKKN